jgi:membrane carboxypeptidase/penicillin-binding protein
MSLRAALRTSSNRAAVRLLQEVGISSAATQAEAMGIGDQPEVPSLALGSGEVTLQTLTAAYAAFANQGRVPRPLLIRRVEDKNGQVLYAAEDSSTPAISAATAYLMADMLAGVIDAGTGARARQLGFKLPAGGKTGTTNDFKDAWFVGFTPRLIAGVWVGFDEPRTILPNGFASNVAVPAWASFMKAATTGDKAEWIEAPPSIVTAHICAESGKLATDACERGHVYTEFFAEGTEPTTSCDIHRPRNVLEAIASLFTSEEKPAPPGLEETGVRASVPPPPPTPQVAAPVVEPPPASEAPARKRGFWSRLFGRGRDGNQSDRGNATNSPAPSR